MRDYYRRLQEILQALIAYLVRILRHFFVVVRHEEIAFPSHECFFNWETNYLIEEFADCNIVVSVRIRLAPGQGVGDTFLRHARDRWKGIIEDRWSRRFRLRKRSGDCGCEEYRVYIVAEFVPMGEHVAIEVRAGRGRDADRDTWFSDSGDEIVAHEFGHLLGLIDEYRDPRCPTRAVETDGGIMEVNDGFPLPRHYAGFAAWISEKSGCMYEVGEPDAGGRWQGPGRVPTA